MASFFQLDLFFETPIRLIAFDNEIFARWNSFSFLKSRASAIRFLARSFATSARSISMSRARSALLAMMFTTLSRTSMMPPLTAIWFCANSSVTREFDTYESKKHPESPRGLIFFVKFIGYILRDLA